MHGKRRFLWFLTSGLLLGTAACTLLLDRDKTQCSTDGDCAKLAAGAVCVDSVCAVGTAADSGGIDHAVADGNSPPDSQGPVNDGAADAEVDANFGIEGCFKGTPVTSADFLNACSHSSCQVFDNCARLGVCGDAGLLPNPPTSSAPGAPPGPDSGATQLCTDLAVAAQRNVIYMTGSSNFPPFLSTFAPVLAQSNYNVVWQVSNSCAGVDSIYNDVQTGVAPNPAKQQIKETAAKVTIYFDDTGKQIPCLLGGPTQVDVGESDIYASTCTATNGYDATAVSPTVVGEYFGPILPMVFVVPAASTETSFSAMAGLSVFGRGESPQDASAPLPYTDPTQLFIRASSTATNQIMSKALGIDPKKWYGVDKGTATNMSAQLQAVAPSSAQRTIGIISADFADSNGNLKQLAFQAQNQLCGFYPDSTPQARDKQNVRDGHYPVWGPIHFFTKVSGGVPTSAAAQNFVARFSAVALQEDFLTSIVKSNVIPSCAMNVTRDTEMGPIHAYDPPVHCGCFFDKTATTLTPPECTVCSTSADCTNPARPSCNFGFCEVH